MFRRKRHADRGTHPSEDRLRAEARDGLACGAGGLRLPAPFGSVSLTLVAAASRETDGVAEVRVPFEELDLLDLTLVWAGVAEDVEPVADVNDVDQAVSDDRVAPH